MGMAYIHTDKILIHMKQEKIKNIEIKNAF